MSCNNFGISVHNKESDSGFLKREILNEIDRKYLDKSEGDKLYVNEDSPDLVDKKYLEKQVQSVKDDLIGKLFLKEVTSSFTGTILQKMLMYYNLALTHKPRVWLSSHFINGLFPKLKKISSVGYGGFEDIMGNKVIQAPISNNPEEGSIYAENISLAGQPYGPAFSLNNLKGKVSRITINIDFKIDYTFIFVCRKVNANDGGSIFTSSISDRILGWDSEAKVFKVGSGEIRLYSNKDTDLHLYIVTCLMGECKFWDIDYKNRTRVIENYGKVVIGKALESLDKCRGLFYEAILFDKALPTEDIESIIRILKIYYNLDPDLKKSETKLVVDNTLLQNLN